MQKEIRKENETAKDVFDRYGGDVELEVTYRGVRRLNNVDLQRVAKWEHMGYVELIDKLKKKELNLKYDVMHLFTDEVWEVEDAKLFIQTDHTKTDEIDLKPEDSWEG